MLCPSRLNFIVFFNLLNLLFYFILFLCFKRETTQSPFGMKSCTAVSVCFFIFLFQLDKHSLSENYPLPTPMERRGIPIQARCIRHRPQRIVTLSRNRESDDSVSHPSANSQKSLPPEMVFHRFVPPAGKSSWL